MAWNDSNNNNNSNDNNNNNKSFVPKHLKAAPFLSEASLVASTLKKEVAPQQQHWRKKVHLLTGINLLTNETWFHTYRTFNTLGYIWSLDLTYTITVWRLPSSLRPSHSWLASQTMAANQLPQIQNPKSTGSIVQGSANPRGPGSVRKRWKSCVPLPAAGKKKQLFPIF